MLADLGHRAIWEAPEETADLVGDFLTGPAGKTVEEVDLWDELAR
jgi:hypothetical protein